MYAGLDLWSLECLLGVELVVWLAQDDANRADNADLGTLWTPQNNSLRITSTLFRPTGDALDCAEWFNGFETPADQYAQCRIIGIPPTTGHGIGPAVRCSPTAFTNYNVVCNTTNTELWIVNATAFTLLASAAVATSGDMVRLEARGATLTVSINGTVVITFNSTTIATGYPGIEAFQAVGETASARDWECGDLNYQIGGIAVPQMANPPMVGRPVTGY